MNSNAFLELVVISPHFEKNNVISSVFIDKISLLLLLHFFFFTKSEIISSDVLYNLLKFVTFVVKHLACSGEADWKNRFID